MDLIVADASEKHGGGKIQMSSATVNILKPIFMIQLILLCIL